MREGFKALWICIIGGKTLCLLIRPLRNEFNKSELAEAENTASQKLYPGEQFISTEMMLDESCCQILDINSLKTFCCSFMDVIISLGTAPSSNNIHPS